MGGFGEESMTPADSLCGDRDTGPWRAMGWIQLLAGASLGKISAPKSPEVDAALHIPCLCTHEKHRVNKTCLERRHLEENGGPLWYSVSETVLRVCGGHVNLSRASLVAQW